MSLPIRQLVEGLVQQHGPSFYKPDHGTFSSRGRAALTIETLRKIVAAALGDRYDSRMLSLEGKHSGVYIYVPRLRHHWWPAPTAETLMESAVKTELNYVITELEKDLTT